MSRTRLELSAFLQRHRQKLSPAEVGLPASGRRRTPGLRREEVAALAGVGLTWYTWLEQGREINVSENVLLNLSRALKLDDAECCHLFLLAQGRPPPAEGYQWVTVPRLVQQMMDELPDRPACVTNLRWDIVAWNPAADALFDLAARPASTRNLLRLVFAEPDMRRRMPDWPDDAAHLLMQFRCDAAVAPEDPALKALVDELSVLSPDFRRWWARPPVDAYRRGVSRMLDAGGRLRHFEHETLIVDEHRHLRMILYFDLPAASQQ